MRRLRRLALAAALLFAAQPAVAQVGPNLIDPFGWVESVGGRLCRIYDGTDEGAVDGSLCLRAEPGEYWTDEDGVLHALPGEAATIEETVPTLAGSLYELRYVITHGADIGGGPTNDVFWGALRVTDAGTYVSDPDRDDIGTLTFALRASGPTTTLRFTSVLTGECVGFVCEDWGSITRLSDLSLRQVAVTATPEPATLGLVGGGLLLVGVATRRRRGHALA